MFTVKVFEIGFQLFLAFPGGVQRRAGRVCPVWQEVGYPIASLILEEKRMPRNPEVSKVQSDTKSAAIQWLMLLGVFVGVVTAIRFFWIHAS